MSVRRTRVFVAIAVATLGVTLSVSVCLDNCVLQTGSHVLVSAFFFFLHLLTICNSVERCGVMTNNSAGSGSINVQRLASLV